MIRSVHATLGIFRPFDEALAALTAGLGTCQALYVPLDDHEKCTVFDQETCTVGGYATMARLPLGTSKPPIKGLPNRPGCLRQRGPYS